MINAKKVLLRVLELVGDSDEYFVSGSLSFLPLLDNYRQPEQDVDVAIACDLFESRKHLLTVKEQIHFLPLSEVVTVDKKWITKIITPKTGFVHIDGPYGLLDIACYREEKNALVFSLGAGLTFNVPKIILQRVQILKWKGITYRAGPSELAFISCAMWYFKLKSSGKDPKCIKPKCIADLNKLKKIIDWRFVHQILEQSELRWLCFKLPFNPGTSDILKLQHSKIA